MDGTILNKKYKFEEKMAALVDDCEDLDDRVTALENAPAPSGGLYQYIETREPIEDITWSHTFQHHPTAVMLIHDYSGGVNFYLATPICFKADHTLAVTAAMVCNSSKQFNPISGLSYDASTKTLSYRAGDMDASFNRTTNTIVYMSDEAPTPVTSRKKSKK